MATETLYSFNWIDILLAAVLFRAVYIGINRGIVTELFKVAGVCSAVFIALHYFSGVSKLLQEKVHLPQAVADLFSFVVLWGVVVIIFKFIRDGFGLLFKMEAAHSILDKWGGFAVAFLRAALICSLMIISLRAVSMDYITKTLEKSLLAVKVVTLAPNFYEATYNNFVSKFFPTEKLNKDVFRLSDFKTEVKQESKKTQSQK